MKKDNPTPSWKPSLWGMLSFGWADKPVGMARRKEPIGIKDLYLPGEQLADPCFEEFEAQWNDIMKSGKSRPLLRTLFSLYGRRFFMGGMFKLLWSVFVICGAFYFVRSLLLYVDEDETDHPYKPDWTGWVLSAGFFMASIVWSALHLFPFLGVCTSSVTL
jgi:ATP-binding cassette, subfamily C (CFTR/MRP), member 1